MTDLQPLDTKSQKSLFHQLPKSQESLVRYYLGPADVNVGSTLGNSELQRLGVVAARGQPTHVEHVVPELFRTRVKLEGVASRRRVELQWRQANRNLLRSYAGQWVVLEGQRIVAAGPSLAEAVKRARENGVAVPYVFRVDESDQDVIRIGI